MRAGDVLATVSCSLYVVAFLEFFVASMSDVNKEDDVGIETTLMKEQSPFHPERLHGGRSPEDCRRHPGLHTATPAARSQRRTGGAQVLQERLPSRVSPRRSLAQKRP